MNRILLLVIIMFMAPMFAVAGTGDYIWNEQFSKKLIKAEQGDARAQYNVGNMYLKGQGTNIDERKAFEWIGKSANQGYLKATFKLGFMYLKGRGTKTDFRNAEKWLRKAANQDYAPAQYYLAGMYRDGQYLAKDYNKALIWLNRAKAGGFWKAASEYDKVIALAQRGGATRNARPAPAPAAAPARVVAAPTPPPGDDDLRDLLLKGKWLERGRPAKYLPSAATQCKKKDNGLYCVSIKDLKGKRGNTTFSYRVIAKIRDITEDGDFSAEYRNNVTTVIQGKPIVIPADEEGGEPVTRPSPLIPLGLQRTVHTLDCQLDNAKQVSCTKDHTVDIQLTQR